MTEPHHIVDRAAAALANLDQLERGLEDLRHRTEQAREVILHEIEHIAAAKDQLSRARRTGRRISGQKPE